MVTKKGIDVSHWQGHINWGKVKADGIDFVMIKATGTNTFVDPMLQENYNGAKKAGLLVGFYHFADISSSMDAIDEAKHYLQAIQGLQADLPHTLDLETDKHGLSPQQLSSYALDWLKTVHLQTKEEVMLYTFPYFAKSQLDTSLKDVDLWYANYNSDNADGRIWKAWRMRQTTSSGHVDGIAGRVDLDELIIDRPSQPEQTDYKVPNTNEPKPQKEMSYMEKFQYMFEQALLELHKKPVSTWAEKEWEEASKNGYFDGTGAQGLITRQETACVINNLRHNFKSLFAEMDNHINELDKRVSELEKK